MEKLCLLLGKATKQRGEREEEQFRGVILTLCVVIDYISGRLCLTEISSSLSIPAEVFVGNITHSSMQLPQGSLSPSLLQTSPAAPAEKH